MTILSLLIRKYISSYLELLKIVYGVDRNIQAISDNFNILPITYAALLGNKNIVTEFLKRNTILTSGKKIPKAAKIKFQPMLKNLINLVTDLDENDDLRKLSIFKDQVERDFKL